jgi:hypothetical protein
MQNAEGKMQNVKPVAVGRLGALGRLGAVALCILHFALATACAKARAAELVPDGPPLAMSAPPPRVITPADEVPLASPAPPPSPEPTAVAAPPAKAPPTPRKPAESKPPEPPAAAAVPPTPPPAEPLEVRSIPSAAEAAEEKKVRDVMNRAQADLQRVAPQRLSTDGRSQYEQARRFYEQADDALKEKNFVYAMKLAENAATLAAELAGR